MIRKHNRRAAKAAFAIALGVAIVLGGTAAAPAAVDQTQATPIIIGTKDFPEQYVLGPALQAGPGGEGLQGAVQGEHRLDGADRQVAPERQGHVLSRVHGDHAQRHVREEDAAEDGDGHVRARQAALRAPRADAAQADAVSGPRRDRSAADDGDEVRAEDGRRPEEGPRASRSQASRRSRLAGRPAAERLYGVKFDFTPLSGISAYTLLDQKKVLAAAIFTTDPQLISTKYVVLKEPRNMFGFQYVAPVLSKKLVTENGTRFTSTVNKVSSLLTVRAMIAMNKAVALDKKPAACVARAFLKANGLS